MIAEKNGNINCKENLREKKAGLPVAKKKKMPIYLVNFNDFYLYKQAL